MHSTQWRCNIEVYKMSSKTQVFINMFPQCLTAQSLLFESICNEVDLVTCVERWSDISAFLWTCQKVVLISRRFLNSVLPWCDKCGLGNFKGTPQICTCNLWLAYKVHFELLELKIDSGQCKSRCPETIHRAKSSKNVNIGAGETLLKL